MIPVILILQPLLASASPLPQLGNDTISHLEKRRPVVRAVRQNERAADQYIS